MNPVTSWVTDDVKLVCAKEAKVHDHCTTRCESLFHTLHVQKINYFTSDRGITYVAKQKQIKSR